MTAGQRSKSATLCIDMVSDNASLKGGDSCRLQDNDVVRARFSDTLNTYGYGRGVEHGDDVSPFLLAGAAPEALPKSSLLVDSAFPDDGVARRARPPRLILPSQEC